MSTDACTHTHTHAHVGLHTHEYHRCPNWLIVGIILPTFSQGYKTDFNYFLNKMLAFYSIFLRTMLSIVLRMIHSVFMRQTANTFLLVCATDHLNIRPFLEKAMVLQYSWAWKCPMDGGKPGGLQPTMLRVRHDCCNQSSRQHRPFFKIIS